MCLSASDPSYPWCAAVLKIDWNNSFNWLLKSLQEGNDKLCVAVDSATNSVSITDNNNHPNTYTFDSIYDQVCFG